MKRNIIFVMYNLSMYDYTLKNINKYLRNEFTVIVFHSSKSSKDRCNCDNFVFDDDRIISIDISDSSIFSIMSTIKCFDPINVIFFTYQSYFDFIVNYICKMSGYKTILHDHGLIFGNRPGSSPIVKRMFNILRLFRFVYRVVIFSFVKRKFLLFNDFIKILVLRKFRYLKFNKYFFFSKSNLFHHKNTIGVENENVCIAGFPIFVDDTEKKILSNKTKNKLLYIHQPFVKLNLTNITYEEEKKFIIHLIEIAKNNGYDFDIRLHPAENMEKYSYLNEYNIKFDKKIPLNEQISSAKIIVGHFSAALINGLGFKIPVFLINYPRLLKKYTNSYSVFGEYCKYVDSIDDVIELLKTESFKNFHLTDQEYLLGKENTYYYNYTELLKQIGS